ncbi:MAG: GAF domain-containing protein, partial [Bacteroidetes bacterium]|nr:GAF domain-containing protein [Bacteroidota bacterium]
DVRTGDELEKLANQFNAMSAELQESYSDLERKVADRTKELATLNAISIVVSRSLNLCEALRDALSKTLQLSGLERGGIYLLNERDGVLSLEVHQGISPDVAADVGSLRLGEGFSGQVAASGEPLVVSDVSSDPRISKIAFAEGVGGSLACVPLSSRGCVLGALFVVSGGHREFTPQDVQILSSIGHQIGVAVENARLYQQAQQLAVVEERNRLARDLHDSVTQAMYSVTLYAEAATRLLSAGQIVSAAEHLRDLRATAQQALREMRSLIFELRPSVLAKEGLVAALQARLESVEGRAGIRTDFQVEGSAQVPAEIESGLYGIAQEALNNVLKHSGAQALRLYLRKDEGVVALEVVDDGTGFELNHGSECGGLGLRGMEERAAVMGGRLIVSSAPGQGTSVRVEVNL